MHTLSASNFLVATAKLLSHGVGSSTGVRIPGSTYRFNSSFSWSLSAVGTLLVGLMTGLTLLSTSKWTSLGKVPNGQSNTSQYCFISSSAVICLTRNWFLRGGGEVTMKFSSLTVTSSISCAALALITGVRSLSATTNSTEYFFHVFGLRMMICAVPMGLTCDPFHICDIFVVDLISWPSACFAGMMLIDAPQSIWKFTFLSSISISA